MCGRYTFFNNFDSLIESFNIDEIDSNIIESKPNYNISPTQYQLGGNIPSAESFGKINMPQQYNNQLPLLQFR